MDRGLRVMTRYARQMALPEIGAEGQRHLARAHVLVVGAGGLGCPALQYLGGAGVGRITVIDPDHVEDSNLHRQPLYRMSDIGRPKVHAAQTHLHAANPDVTIRAYHQALHPANARHFISEAKPADAPDVVIDAADSFAVSYCLSDTCRSARTPLISASALEHSGYAGGFCGPDAPSLRAVFPDLPARGATCATAGVLGPVVGMIGALQAQMALQLLLPDLPSPLGRMVTLDLRNLHFGGFSFHAAPDPQTVIPFLSKSDLHSSDQVIDLRPAKEAPIPVVPHAQRLSSEEITALPHDPPHRVVLACATGLRAWRAANTLHRKGWRSLAILAAGACE